MWLFRSISILLAVTLQLGTPSPDYGGSDFDFSRDIVIDTCDTISEADAILKHLLADDPSPEQLTRATELYLHILSHVGEELEEEEHVILVRHIAQLLIILPEKLGDRLVRAEHPRNADRWRLRPVAEELLAWWRQQNPLPATRINERLREHLRRVAYARTHYPHRSNITGVDDRGRTLIQYGFPDRETSITFNDSRFHREVFRFGVNVSISDFPENELWLYPHIDRQAYFLFVEAPDGYREVDPRELIPRRLRSGLHANERGMNRAVSALGAMQHIYRELALYHINFSRRYASVDDYLMRQEERGLLSELGVPQGEATRRSRAGYGVEQERDVYTDPVAGLTPINEFAQRELARSRTEDREARRVRDLVMPPSYSEVLEGVVALPVAFRWARFLDEDNRTRTEFYWAVNPRGMKPTEGQQQILEEAGQTYEDMLLQVTATRYSSDYEPQEVTIDHHLVPGGVEAEGPGAIRETVSFVSKFEPYHIAVQWNQHLFNLDRTELDLDLQGAGPIVKIGTARLDSLGSLDTTGHTLEMSDLKPLDSRDDEVALEEADPYPFEHISPGTSLPLYFEVYNLMFEEEDRTRFSVEYEVHRVRKRGGLAQLFRGDEEQRTVSEAAYEADGRRAQEYIMVDLDDVENADHVTITVRVTDETSGEQVERSISFAINQER